MNNNLFSEDIIEEIQYKLPQYDRIVYNILNGININAASLYVSLNFILLHKPPHYEMLVAHCMREIISYLLVKRGKSISSDWKDTLKNIAKEIDEKEEQPCDNNQQVINRVLNIYDEKYTRKKQYKQSIIEINRSCQEKYAEYLANKIKELNIEKYVHTGIDHATSDIFDRLIRDFNLLIKDIENLFVTNKVNIEKILEQSEINVEKKYEQIRILLSSQSLEHEFYSNLISGKVEWFDILQEYNIFDFNSFTEQVKENDLIINILWEPFFYLQSVFSQIPDKVIPIFKVIMEKHLKKQPVNISWYVSRILTVLSENINNLTPKDIMVVIEPFKYLIPEGRPFYEVKLLAPILEKLLETGQDKFVEQILTRILMVSGYKTEDKTKEITFASWQDYYYFLEIIEKTELEKKYPTFCFQAFVNVLCSIYEQFPLYTGLDIYGMNYLTKQDKAYLHPELLVINKILSFADKIHGEDLTKFYNRLQKLDNIVTIQNILCYFADVHNDLNIAAKFLLKFADYNCYPYFGTSDYINLAFKKFDKLSLEQRESILDKRNGFYLDWVKQQKKLDARDNIRLIQNYFVPFRKGLTPKYQELYGHELSDADISDYIDDGNDKVTIKTWGGNQSILSKEEIESKNIPEIVECIKYFKEPDNAYFQDKPSIQGTAELISKYINKNKELLKDVELFEDASIHPQYHYSLVFNMGFNKDENITIENIRHFISYMDWISKQSNNTFIDTKTKMFLVQDYYQTCMWIPRKIQEIIANYVLESNDYKNILDILIRNIEKTDDLTAEVREQGDYYALSINTVLGTNLEEIIKLAFKLYEIKNTELLEQASNIILKLLQQKNKVVFATVGRFYPWMHLIFNDKISAVKKILFQKDDKELFVAWFGAYLLNTVYLNIYPDIKNEYLYAAQEIFSNDKYSKSIMQERLGEHLGVVFYLRKISKNDPLLSALFSNTALLRKAIWWIATNTAHEKKLEIDVNNVQQCIDELIDYIEQNNKWSEMKEVLDFLGWLLASNKFNDNVKWLLNTLIKVLVHQPLNISYMPEAYQNLENFAKNPAYQDNVLQFMELYLVRDEYIDKYSPQSFGCPYYLQEKEINNIFDKLVVNPSKEQKIKLDKIFNALCNYGYYHNIKKYYK